MRKHDQGSAAAEGARRATGSAPERDRKGRFSARRKRATVLRLLRGEDLESVSRELGITAARASQWRDQFLSAGQAGLKSRVTEAVDDDRRRLRGQNRRTADWRTSCCMRRWTTWRPASLWPAGGRRDEWRPVDLHPSGVWGAARLLRVGAAEVECVCAAAGPAGPACWGHRRGPVGAAPDEVLVVHIRRVLEASPFHGEGYRKVWAKLRVEGIRTSKERVRRLMREHHLQAPHRVGQAHGPKAHDGTITTETPDVMWGTDMTTTVTGGEGTACVFVAVDHCTTECIGLHAAKRGTRFEALEPIRQGVRERFGGIGDGAARGLRLRHDHGSNYLADDFQQEVAFFGIDSSPSFVREPEGNGVAERFIRTLKENLLWVRSFDTIEELRLALLAFKRTYNEQWMLEKYDYRSPAQVRRDLVGLDAAA